MIIKRRKRKAAGDSGASSDLAFLLIIYFIVIAGFNINKGFLLTLPAKDSQRLIQKEELLRFNLDSGGGLIFQGAPCDYPAAEREIRSKLASYPNMALLLTVDPQTPWQALVSFVELAQDLEVDSFSFVMDKSGGGDS
ncbi:MAG: biopolymer transporter ExbD [Treponema sp.]|jgi:biopolymer transport protein ExbD|nr:biopolymer transporter ExbD [Treponema sp.]